MGRISETFGSAGRPLFIAFIVAGDPDMETSVAVAGSLIAGGADILELGVPFSDPVADGPVIQRADTRAIAAGATPDMVFSIVRCIRLSSSVPVVLLTYYNLVFRRGIDKFFLDAADAGADGIIIADMPVEESDEAVTAAQRSGIDLIFMVSETTSTERLMRILKNAGGFLYLVSRAGVTGVRQNLSPGITAFIRRVKEHTTIPVAVGFGVATPEHAVSLYSGGADGVIAGSAIVALVEKNLGNPERMLTALSDYMASMKNAAMSRRKH
jgi:tryptophan synthase alpha chain